MKLNRLIVFIFLCSWGVLSAQKVEIGVMGGASLYSGDLSPDEFGIYFNEINPAFGFFGRLNVGRAFSGRLGINFGKLTGADSNRKDANVERDLRFRSNITEIALTGEYYFLRLGRPGRVEFKPYVYGGAAVFSFNPEGFYDNGWIELQPLHTEAQGAPGYEQPYELTQLSIPLGGGVRFIFNDSWSIGFEFGGRKVFTDHIDDISFQEIIYRDVLENSGTRAAQLSNPLITNPEDYDTVYRRGGKFDDWYYFGNITVSFFLNGDGGWGRGQGMGCPTNF